MAEAESNEPLYKLQNKRTLRVRVHYPHDVERLVLRTEQDWNRDILPVEVQPETQCAVFELELASPYLYFKACLNRPTAFHWDTGANRLLIATRDEGRDIYPAFYSQHGGKILDVLKMPSKILGRTHKLRIFVPAGYDENTCRTFPVMYMQDGKNLFFPEEAFLGQDWDVEGKLVLLNQMNAVEQMIIVGIYSADRMNEYTSPGYEAYGRSVVEEIKPYIDAHFRTRPAAQSTGVMGSSLGGVVSFFMGWQWPDVFGNVGCLSSTFSFRDNLIERVLTEQRRKVRFYLDTGWPEDNYEVGLAMAVALAERGYRYGEDFLYLAFPNAGHSEADWSKRLHLPFQFFAGWPALIARQLRNES